MFHLLVKYAVWSFSQDSLAWDRALKYTDPALVEYFAPGGTLALERLASIPALFISEKGGKGPQHGRVGTITSIQALNGVSHFQYIFDARLPPIPMFEVEELCTHLALDPFELIHTALGDQE
ncbi:MAG TPA: hypothetical protein VIV60_28045 [Polyangiaceae bacterium]